MALTGVNIDEQLVLLEEEYVVLVRRLRPERFTGNSLAQNSARHLLSKIYDWHQRAVRELEARRQQIIPSTSFAEESPQGVEPGAEAGQRISSATPPTAECSDTPS